MKPLLTAFLVAVFCILTYVNLAEAKTFTTPSGAVVEVKETTNKIWRNFVLPSGISYVAEVLIPIAHADNMTKTEEIIIWIKSFAEKYNVSSDQLLALATCESGMNPEAVGDHGKAYGLFQYWLGTFNAFVKEGKFEGFEYKDWKSQSELTAWAFSKNLQEHWHNCYHYILDGKWPTK